MVKKVLFVCFLFQFTVRTHTVNRTVHSAVFFFYFCNSNEKKKTSKAKEECAYKCFWMRKKNQPTTSAHSEFNRISCVLFRTIRSITIAVVKINWYFVFGELMMFPNESSFKRKWRRKNQNVNNLVFFSSPKCTKRNLRSNCEVPWTHRSHWLI